MQSVIPAKHLYLNMCVTIIEWRFEYDITEILRNIGNVPLTWCSLIFLTLLYMVDILLTYCNGSTNYEDPDIINQQLCGSPIIPDIVKEIHHSASKLYNKNYEAKCMELLNVCPEAINTPKPPYMYTPFLKACSFGNCRAVQYMLQKGADVTAHTKDGETPLYLALWNQMYNHDCWDPSCIDILYIAGCDVNAAKRHGYTPLHAAAKSGNINAIQWLLKHGANPHRLTRCNMRPIDYAINQGHEEAAALLMVYS